MATPSSLWSRPTSTAVVTSDSANGIMPLMVITSRYRPRIMSGRFPYPALRQDQMLPKLPGNLSSGYRVNPQRDF